MIKIQTRDLTGLALDWAVAKCEGLLDPRERFGKMLPAVVIDMKYWTDRNPIVRVNPCPDVYYRAEYDPSTNWEFGGPIIEREKLDLFCSGNMWDASTGDRGNNDIQSGPTPLIAAMRCYVANKLGNDIEIPKELVK